MVAISSWGRLTRADHRVVRMTDLAGAGGLLRANPGGIAYGMGRSYGDACLNDGGVLWATAGLDRFMLFDVATGRIGCEAGVLLRDIQQLAVPRGWMLPVSPGTQFVTVGGAIANDVHGKNHHVFGSFGDAVRRLVLQRTDGERIECAPDLRPDWFRASVGGLGLTGLILSAEIQLRPVAGAWLDAESLPYSNLDQFFELADSSETGWEYTAAWVDCLSGATGRGIFMRANHVAGGGAAPPARRALRVPFTPPVSLVNRLSLRLFNETYFQLGRWRAGRASTHYAAFLYPLDGVDGWNRMYGPRGFFQYQFVVPPAVRREALREVLAGIADSGIGSFLAVLKTFGDRVARGMLSFPQPGVTLALDFPNAGTRAQRLFERIDRIVADAGGRVYMAKDARMPRWLFEVGYPERAAFGAFRDPGISSAMSRRLLGS